MTSHLLKYTETYMCVYFSVRLATTWIENLCLMFHDLNDDSRGFVLNTLVRGM
jgi:hypothetical protein